MRKILSAELFEWFHSAARPITFLVKVHPEDSRPLYLKSFRSGEYTCTFDPHDAHPYTFRTASAHLRNILNLAAPVSACYNNNKFEEENHMKKYQVIGGQYEQHHYGESDTLRGARIIAGKHREYWDNWQGWHTPAVYLAEDCEVIEAHGMITVPDGQRVIVHKPDAEPVQ